MALRPFSSHLQRLADVGRSSNDTGRPWHIGYNRWLASYLTLLIVVVLMSVVVTSSVDPVEGLSYTEMALAVWALGTLVDEVQEMWETGAKVYWKLFNILDLVGALSQLAYVCLRLYGAHGVQGDGQRAVAIVTRANDALALSVLCVYTRLLAVYEISPSVGPLLVTLQRLFVRDVTRFLLLVVVTLLAFSMAALAVFKGVCTGPDDAEPGTPPGSAGQCSLYNKGWPIAWHDSGLMGVIVMLEFQLFGQGASQAWQQKPYTGLMLYSLFTAIMGLIFINLFIAMMANTYAEVQDRSMQEYKHVRAQITYAFCTQDAVYPPLNLLHIGAGFVGNCFRRLLGMRDNLIPLRKTLDRSREPLFTWYEAEEGGLAKRYLPCRRDIFTHALDSVATGSTCGSTHICTQHSVAAAHADESGLDELPARSVRSLVWSISAYGKNRK